MAWSEKRRLPADWEKRRKAQLEADGYRCVVVEGGLRCAATIGLEVDHARRSNDHDHLQTLCHYHHQLKTSEEAAAGLARKRERISKKFVRTEAHPSAW